MAWVTEGFSTYSTVAPQVPLTCTAHGFRLEKYHLPWRQISESSALVTLTLEGFSTYRTIAPSVPFRYGTWCGVIKGSLPVTCSAASFTQLQIPCQGHQCRRPDSKGVPLFIESTKFCPAGDSSSCPPGQE